MTKQQLQAAIQDALPKHFKEIKAEAHFLPDHQIRITTSTEEHDILKHLWDLTSQFDIDLLEYTMHVQTVTEEEISYILTINPLVIEN